MCLHNKDPASSHLRTAVSRINKGCMPNSRLPSHAYSLILVFAGARIKLSASFWRQYIYMHAGINIIKAQVLAVRQIFCFVFSLSLSFSGRYRRYLQSSDISERTLSKICLLCFVLINSVLLNLLCVWILSEARQRKQVKKTVSFFFSFRLFCLFLSSSFLLPTSFFFFFFLSNAMILRGPPQVKL